MTVLTLVEISVTLDVNFISASEHCSQIVVKFKKTIYNHADQYRLNNYCFQGRALAEELKSFTVQLKSCTVQCWGIHVRLINFPQ